MMTARDFHMLADVLLAVKKEANTEASHKYRDALIVELTKQIKATHPRFNEDHFLCAAEGTYPYPVARRRPPRPRFVAMPLAAR